MFTANIVPGQGFQPLTVYTKSNSLTNTGRPVSGGYAQTDTVIYGMIVAASQREIEQFKQNGHPVTHRIIQYAATEKAKPTDYLVLHDGRKFYVQGLKNHADLNVSVSYYVEERLDIV